MTKRKGFGCPCKVGVSKARCGVRGLGGTPAQHAAVAREHLKVAQKWLRIGHVGRGSGAAAELIERSLADARCEAKWASPTVRAKLEAQIGAVRTEVHRMEDSRPRPGSRR